MSETGMNPAPGKRSEQSKAARLAELFPRGREGWGRAVPRDFPALQRALGSPPDRRRADRGRCHHGPCARPGWCARGCRALEARAHRPRCGCGRHSSGVYGALAAFLAGRVGAGRFRSRRRGIPIGDRGDQPRCRRPPGFHHRVGRNEAFNHAGNAATAILAGVAGYFIHPSATLWIAAAPRRRASPACRRDQVSAIDHQLARGADDSGTLGQPNKLAVLFESRNLLLFTAAITLFHFANAAMLPLLGEKLSRTNQAAARCSWRRASSPRRS